MNFMVNVYGVVNLLKLSQRINDINVVELVY